MTKNKTMTESKSSAHTLLKHGVVTFAGLLAVFVLGGCKQETLCSELGTCGGTMPVGNWALSPGHGSCSEDLYTPPTDTRLVAADLIPARSPPPEPALFDWCLLLVTSGGAEIQARPPRFYYESGPIGEASVKYQADGRYTVGVTRTGTYVLDFPAKCMTEFGATDKPSTVPGGPPLTLCQQLEPPLRSSGLGEGSYRNTTCIPNPAETNGCLCYFDVSEAGGSAGRWEQTSPNTIVHYAAMGFPQKVTFCNKGGSLDLTGADGEYLFSQRGLRTMNLTPVAEPAPAAPAQ